MGGNIRVNREYERGFTTIEAISCLFVVLSMMIPITLKIMENRNNIKEDLRVSFVMINYIKLTEIFYNEETEFLDEVKKFFSTNSEYIIFLYENEEIKIKYNYNIETVTSDVNDVKLIIYRLKIEFPQEFKNYSQHLFSDLELVRWKNV